VGKAPRHVRELLAGIEGPLHIDADTIAIAEGFLKLHEQRDQADYDHEEVFRHADTRRYIALARRVVELAQKSDSDQAQQFFGLIAMQAQVRGRRHRAICVAPSLRPERSIRGLLRGVDPFVDLWSRELEVARQVCDHVPGERPAGGIGRRASPRPDRSGRA